MSLYVPYNNQYGFSMIFFPNDRTADTNIYIVGILKYHFKLDFKSAESALKFREVKEISTKIF